MNARIVNHIYLFVAASVVLNAAFAQNAHSGEDIQVNDRGERISYIENDHIRLGVNLGLGGAITYLADTEEQINLVNNHDWGRQIQMSFYSGPNPFEPNGKRPSDHWRQLGWNPIQSGDYAGIRSTIVRHTSDGESIHVQCVPMQWPLEDEPGECTFESWITLNENVAHVRCRLNNARQDTTQYRGRSQELPAIYTNGPWHRLITYTGEKPFTGEAVVEIPKKTGPGFPWSRFVATECWTALVREDDTGLGVWNKEVYRTLGGFAGKPGIGGSYDGPTGYISPLHTEILDHNIQYEYEYRLILGSIEEIRRYAYEQDRPAPAPRYVFDRDRQHCHYMNAEDNGWPVRGHLHIAATGANPRIVGPLGFWQAEDMNRFKLEAAVTGETSQAHILWQNIGDTQFTGEKSLLVEVTPDGKFRTYDVDLSAHPRFKGIITQIAIRLPLRTQSAEHAKVRSIIFDTSRTSY